MTVAVVTLLLGDGCCSYAVARVTVAVVTLLLGGWCCRYNQLLQQKAQLEDLEKALKAEQEKMVLESKNHEATAKQLHTLRDENDK